jgi:hypothetical protein
VLVPILLAVLGLAVPVRAQPPDAAAAPPAVSTSAPAEAGAPDAALAEDLRQADGLYADAVGRLKDGRGDEARSELKRAFGILVEDVDDPSLAAALRPEFSAMLDRVRNWQGPAPAGETASDLDVPEDVLRASTSVPAGRMRDIRIDPDNALAQKFLAIYTKQRPGTVEEALARSGRYRDMIEAELKKKGLPPELFYLVMVESEYKPDAVSPSGAAGLWQFMPGTARKYGLEVSYWVDERFDPEKATVAAARYLSDLYQWFGDWELALAAYNRGEGGIGRDLQFSRSLDFDSLSGRKALPQETHHYVPKFMACVLIGRDPKKYGLRAKYEEPEPYDEVPLPRDLDLGVAAKCAGVPESVLRRLNPELRSWCTPKDRPGFLLRVPKGAKDSFLAALAKVDEWNPGPTLVRYRVVRGDSLGRIAKQYHTTVRGILETNKLRSARLIRPGITLLIKPGRAGRPGAVRRRRR